MPKAALTPAAVGKLALEAWLVVQQYLLEQQSSSNSRSAQSQYSSSSSSCSRWLLVLLSVVWHWLPMPHLPRCWMRRKWLRDRTPSAKVRAAKRLQGWHL